MSKKIVLNGISYRWGDLYDSWNQAQKDHFDGIIDIYALLCEMVFSTLVLWINGRLMLHGDLPSET